MRERKREIALRLVADGKFGGAVAGRLGGYRTHQAYHRKVLMQEAVAENARKNTQGIIKALEGMLNSGDKRIQLEAIREYRAVEDWTQKNLREEERELRNLKGDELDDALKDALASVLGVDLALLESIDGEAEEIDEQGELVSSVDDNE
jgi:hypothetical protein